MEGMSHEIGLERNYKSKEQLPTGDVPAHAVKFKEPNSMVALNIVATVFVIPVFVLIGFAVFSKSFFIGHVVEISLFNL